MTDTHADSIEQQREKRWNDFCQATAEACHPVTRSHPVGRILAEAFGFSEFVASSCMRNPRMVADLTASGDLFRAYGDDEMARKLSPRLESVGSALPDAGPDEFMPDLKKTLRRYRCREMVRIAIRDLTGLSGLEETTADLSALAAAAIDGALDLIYERLCGLEGTPCEPNGTPQRLVVLGMGKLGAGELNFSSDVDLIFAFPKSGETRGGRRALTNVTFFTRLCRLLIQAIGENTVDGFVFRVDTRLRPYGDGGPLVMNFDHMEDYYQSQGREWERYALIKAGIVGGDRGAGRQLLQSLKPFVFRRYLDFGVFESLREMKRKITAEVRRKGLDRNIKLGGGGIREIEFFGQMFQLIRGGVLADLQRPAILAVLDTLAREAIVPEPVCRELADAYRFLRNTEHRLQMAADHQTHDLPTSPIECARLAQSMGFETWEAFRDALDRHRRNVSRHFGGLLAAEDGESGPDKTIGMADAWTASLSSEECCQILENAGFPDGTTAAGLLADFKSEPATRSLSGAGKRRLDRLIPRVLEAVVQVDDPITVLRRMLDLLARIEQRISYLALLLEYPTALTHLVRLVGASPWIAAFLSRHPVLLDELLDPRTLYTPPGPETLRQGLVRQLARVPEDDPEYQMEALCIFRQVNTLRVAASDITSVLPLMKVSDHLTWIAETILETVVETCWRHLVAQHGRPSCTLNGAPCDKGFAVIGYGKLGGLELGYGSDLDLVFLHAADEGTTSGGPRPIDNTHFFARLGQRVVHMLSAHTPAGTLYETDMRLRPNGSSGLLVSHVNGFASYQRENAWTWEHQALIRARPITGDPSLLDEFIKIRQQVLCLARDPQPLKKEVREMRERMRKNRRAGRADQFDIKEDAGAMIDIEFIVQYLVLKHAAKHPDITRWTDNVRLLHSLAETGIVEGETAYRLRQAYLIFRATVHRLDLQEQSVLVDSDRFGYLRKRVQGVWQQTLD